MLPVFEGFCHESYKSYLFQEVHQMKNYDFYENSNLTNVLQFDFSWSNILFDDDHISEHDQRFSFRPVPLFWLLFPANKQRCDKVMVRPQRCTTNITVVQPLYFNRRIRGIMRKTLLIRWPRQVPLWIFVLIFLMAHCIKYARISVFTDPYSPV